MTPDQIIRRDVYAVTEPLPAYHRGRTALLGDAAHPMTPNLGEGGNQAIEDAVVLAHRADPLHSHADALGDRLTAYTEDRLPRTTEVVRYLPGAAGWPCSAARPLSPRAPQ